MASPASRRRRGEVLLLHPVRLRAERARGRRGAHGQQAAAGPATYGGRGVGRGQQGEGPAGGEAEGDAEDEGGVGTKGKGYLQACDRMK